MIQIIDTLFYYDIIHSILRESNYDGKTEMSVVFGKIQTDYKIDFELNSLFLISRNILEKNLFGYDCHLIETFFVFRTSDTQFTNNRHVFRSIYGKLELFCSCFSHTDQILSLLFKYGKQQNTQNLQFIFFCL